MARQQMLLAAAAAITVGAAPPVPPPIATYWVSAATDRGMGAGMGRGGAAGMAAMMMGGRGGGASRTLTLQLGSRTPTTSLDVGEHLPPAGLGVGPSLPLRGTARGPVTEPGTYAPEGFERPRGRMLVYWGCGEHVGPGQPLVIDFSRLAAGQMPPGWGAVAGGTMPPRPAAGRGYGEWPNDRDRKAVPVNGSLVGTHSLRSPISPPLAFTLGPNQDFMPSLELAERGALPSGASRLGWRPAPTATGYALSLMGASDGGGQGGDVIVWSSSSKGSAASAMGLVDYLPPARVRQLIAAGDVLPPTTSECLLPAEVARAAPMGFVRIIGFGPEADFAEAPRAPKWVAKVRFKTSASLIRGMPAMGGAERVPVQPGQPAPRRKPGLRDILKGAIRPRFR